MKKENKAEAIRAVGANDLSQTNAQIKQKVQRLYGYQVSSSEIINQLGAYADRKHMGRSSKRRIALAKEFVGKVGGDLREAVRLLHLSQAK